MSTERKALDTKAGVVLEEVTIFDRSFPVDRTFVVKSRRSPESRNFGGFGEAQQYFYEEVERSSRNGQ